MSLCVRGCVESNLSPSGLDTPALLCAFIEQCFPQAISHLDKWLAGSPHLMERNIAFYCDGSQHMGRVRARCHSQNLRCGEEMKVMEERHRASQQKNSQLVELI